MASQMGVTFVNMFLCPKRKSFPKVHFEFQNPMFSGETLQKSNSDIIRNFSKLYRKYVWYRMLTKSVRD